jgi:hypothetical protein
MTMTEAPQDFLDAHPYASEEERPGPDAPRVRLPVPHRQVWAALQDGLRTLPRIKETVMWCGTGWKWSWKYSVSDDEVAYLIPSDMGVCAVLIVGEGHLEGLLAHPDVQPRVSSLVEECSAEKRRCWMPIMDISQARDFLISARALVEVIRSQG